MSKDDTCVLSETELAAWHQAMRDVKPYEQQEMQTVSLPDSFGQSTSPHQRFARRVDYPDKPGNDGYKKREELLSSPPKNNFTPLKAGSFAGVDAATVKKIKRGQMPIEASIDLHGLYQGQAFGALQRCVMQALMQRKRLILVITGKGRDGKGVLKEALPDWLNDGALRPYLLAFDWARREDGGSGAAYVLLKKLVVQDGTDDFSGG